MSAFDLLIVGTGSQACYVIDNSRQHDDINIIGIADIEDPDNTGKSVDGIPIICSLPEVPTRFSPDKCRVIVAYGANDRKMEIVSMLEDRGFQFATIISSYTYVSPSAQVAEGSIINPMASVMPNARIGRHAIVHSQAVIEHDNVIGDFANIGPGVSLGGRVHIGKGSHIYTGASVIPDISVGEWAVIGAGSVVLRDVAGRDTVAGVPARSIARPTPPSAAASS